MILCSPYLFDWGNTPYNILRKQKCFQPHQLQSMVYLPVWKYTGFGCVCDCLFDIMSVLEVSEEPTS